MLLGVSGYNYATLQSSRHRDNSITFATSGAHSSPCGVLWVLGVKTGTGKFTHAVGYVDVTFNYTGSQYTDTWSGTVTF